MLKVFLVILFLLWLAGQGMSQMHLSQNFENGNGLLSFRDQSKNEISLMPEIKRRDRELVWFHGKLSGHRKDTLLTVHIPFQKASYAPNPLLVRIGKTWQRIPAEDHAFFKTYRFHGPSDTLTLATGVPYSYSDLLHFLHNHSSGQNLSLDTLCISEEGLAVPLLIFQTQKSKPKGTLYFQARQHAFEAPSSYFMQGLIKEMATQFGNAHSVLKNYKVLIVPMVDVDNVREGAYGKDQFPVDFNRDWVEKPNWKAVSAIQNLLLTIEKEAPVVFTLDCHAPHPITKSYSHYYLALADSATQTQNLKKLMAIHQKGEGYKMISQRNNRIKPGECNFNLWVHQADAEKKPRFPRLLAGTTYEQSWQEKPDGSPYTTEETEKSGQGFVRALAEFLSGKP